MEYFKKYVSNTVNASSNQFFFTSDGKSHTGRVFYKVFSGGEYEYSFLFSNIIDSTFSDGSVSHKNLICDSWDIIGMRAGVCDRVDNNIPESSFHDITFGGKASKEVMPGEFFSSDPVTLNIQKNEYICLEITFMGYMIPHHLENLFSAYVKDGDSWEFCNNVPAVSMVGCSKKVKRRIGYLGDSITQGIGTSLDSYTHWNAVLSEKLGEEYAYWNLGIGFARANDAASDGAWLYKAKQNDVVIVCCGVNDISHIPSEEQIKEDIKTIVEKLKQNNIKVILQTVPPFDYTGEKIGKWERINTYIKTELSELADMVFDVVPVLRESEENPQNAKYGGHPNAEGCKAWADAFYLQIKDVIDN